MKHMFGCGMIDADNRRNKVRKADLCFVLAILAAAFVSFLIIRLQSTKGSYAVVSYNGEALLSQILLEQPEPVYYLLTYENSDEQNSIITDNIDKSNMCGNSTLDMSGTLGSNVTLSNSSILGSDGTLDKSNSFDNGGITIRKLLLKEWETIDLPDTEYNVFICGNNEIRMLQSSCPDKICVHHSAISNTGENIICLPHQLVIEIKGGKENDLDGVAY